MSFDRRKYRSERTQLVENCFQILSRARPVSNVLDIACREGLWLRVIQRQHPLLELTGIDIDPDCIKRARRLAHGITYVCSDSLAYLNEQRQQYDVILCMGMLYYYYNVETLVTLLSQRAKCGLLIDTFCLRDKYSSDNEIRKIDNTPNRMTKWAVETKRQVRIPSYGALCSILSRSGLSVERIDSYSSCYDAHVGKRLGVPLQRVGVLARHEVSPTRTTVVR